CGNYDSLDYGWALSSKPRTQPRHSLCAGLPPMRTWSQRKHARLLWWGGDDLGLLPIGQSASGRVRARNMQRQLFSRSLAWEGSLWPLWNPVAVWAAPADGCARKGSTGWGSN